MAFPLFYASYEDENIHQNNNNNKKRKKKKKNNYSFVIVQQRPWWSYWITAKLAFYFLVEQ